MNLSPRPDRFDFWRTVRAFRAAFDYHLRNLMVIWYGAHLAGMLAAFFLVVQGATQAADFIPALMVSCIAGVLLAVVALWGIRYPRPVEPVTPAPPTPPQFTPEQIAAVNEQMRDLNPLPGREEPQSYQATMARRDPAPNIRMDHNQLARYIAFLLENDGEVSARRMMHIGTPADTAKLRRWLWSERYAIERNKTAVLTDHGRAELNALLPRLTRGG